MRKIISLALAAMLVLALVPASFAADDYKMNENFATTIFVVTASCGTASTAKQAEGIAAFTLKDGESVSAPNGDFKTGKISYKDGVVTIENCTGIKRIEAYDGSMIINAVGVNTFENADQGRGFFIDDHAKSDCADLTITSSTGGEIIINSKQYAVYSRAGNVVVSGNVKLTVNCSGIEAIGLGWYNRGVIAFKDNCVCNLTGITNAVHVSKDGAILFEDNANVTVTAPTGNAFFVGGDGAESSYVFSGNPTVKANAASGTAFAGKDLTMNVNGGTVEAAGTFTADGTAVKAAGTITAGDDAASAKAAKAEDIVAAKYVKIAPAAAAKPAAATQAAASTTKTTTAAKTADASVVLAAVALVACAGVVVCKKKH